MNEQSKELTSVAAGLFFGQIDEGDLFPFPALSDSQREMALAMVGEVSRFMEHSVDAAKMDQESLIPDEVYQGLAELGLMGMAVPEEWGGLGLDATLYARVFSEISDGSLGAMLGAHQSIGYKALMLYGNEEQKKKYLSRLASGEIMAAFCLTEPGSGSDAYSIKTKATDNGDGTFSISGQKLWITNGGKADFYTVLCKTDHQIEGEKKEKITCFIVEKGTPGISFGEKEKKLGIKASETRAVFFRPGQSPRGKHYWRARQGF